MHMTCDYMYPLTFNWYFLKIYRHSNNIQALLLICKYDVVFRLPKISLYLDFTSLSIYFAKTNFMMPDNLNS